MSLNKYKVAERDQAYDDQIQSEELLKPNVTATHYTVNIPNVHKTN